MGISKRDQVACLRRHGFAEQAQLVEQNQLEIPEDQLETERRFVQGAADRQRLADDPRNNPFGTA